MEIGNVEEVMEASKSEDDDNADTLTDIDELLRDKLREGELVAVVELEEKKADIEVVQINTENEASVGVISTNVSTEDEDCTEDEDIKTEINEIVNNISKDIKIKDMGTAEEDSKDETKIREQNEIIGNQTPPRSHGRPRIKKDSESLKPKLKEIKVKIEAISNELLDQKQIVESEIVDLTLNKTAQLDKPDEVDSLIVQENETESVIKLSNTIVTEEKIPIQDTPIIIENVDNAPNVTNDAKRDDIEHVLESMFMTWLKLSQEKLDICSEPTRDKETLASKSSQLKVLNSEKKFG